MNGEFSSDEPEIVRQRAAWDDFKQVLDAAGVEVVENLVNTASTQARKDGLSGAFITSGDESYAVSAGEKGVSFRWGDRGHRISFETAEVAILDMRIQDPPEA